VGLLSAAPFAIFLELYFALNEFFVLAGPIIYALAGVAGEFDESVLGHVRHYKLTSRNYQLRAHLGHGVS